MKKESGFTLIEIIITLILLGIMGAIGAMLIVQGAQSYITAKTSNELSQKAQLALNRMILEFEDISTISSANANSVCYTLRYYDVNTGSTNDINRCVGLDGSQINIGPTVATGSVLVDNVGAFQLNYYRIDDSLAGNGTWTAANLIRDLAIIKITLTLNRTDVAGETYTCSTFYNVRRNGIIGRDSMPLNWNM
ncbi:MAG: prepilin-type N-terminal cleavage/methylation domain-containing protein [Syntrophaceae bacterium]|nr:prepilin-type N-terminal cleavage/methylation domain-containing protein [Syntrophaceae bacterium]